MSDASGVARPRNALNGYRQLIQNWTTPTEVWRDRGADIRRGPMGHINADGAAECGHAAIYVPREERFFESLEPGVRALVMALVGEWNWITYTSCEGHPKTETASMRRRNVGLLPRSDAEGDLMSAVLTSALASMPRAAPGAAAELGILHHSLDTEEGVRPCVDLVFYPRARDWAAYVLASDALQRDLVERLRAHPARPHLSPGDEPSGPRACSKA